MVFFIVYCFCRPPRPLEYRAYPSPLSVAFGTVYSETLTFVKAASISQSALNANTTKTWLTWVSKAVKRGKISKGSWESTTTTKVHAAISTMHGAMSPKLILARFWLSSTTAWTQTKQQSPAFVSSRRPLQGCFNFQSASLAWSHMAMATALMHTTQPTCGPRIPTSPFRPLPCVSVRWRNPLFEIPNCYFKILHWTIILINCSGENLGEFFILFFQHCHSGHGVLCIGSPPNAPSLPSHMWSPSFISGGLPMPHLPTSPPFLGLFHVQMLICPPRRNGCSGCRTSPSKEIISPAWQLR